ncbi:MAG: hypothetical protein CVV64_12985 [Candidatus Wallbacteria bacterium HGW-Wallbacteria-1]|uniref:Uncharacterized protein n=1 Tax=Candidatus Wallbacteria bacterium HGW-Wallbacteria-1 TaxID=2013854 RepID=A0A2N1PMY6_9BACT|nr:MAG: hypothetical protein CVV64_12985 [Candidatus Wallbacteria bacterium HGW-Wallbacteria-1]
MKHFKITTPAVLIIPILIFAVMGIVNAVAAQSLWQRDMNGSLYVLQQINGVATVFGYPTENDVAKPRETYTAPGTVKIAVDSEGNLFTLRRRVSGNNYLYDVYRNVRGNTGAGNRLWTVTGGLVGNPGNCDIGVCSNTKQGGPRVYVLLTKPTPKLYFNGAISQQSNAIVSGQLASNSRHILVMPYLRDKDYVQVHTSNSYDLQALWKPIPGQGGTTGYLYQKLNNQIWMVHKPTGTPFTEGELANDVQASIGDSYADTVQYYRTRYDRNLSFVGFNSGTGNMSIYNLLFDSTLNSIRTLGWANSWATMGNNTQLLLHMATPNVLSGKAIGSKLVIYEPILKLNPNAILEDEIHDPDGDNLADEGYLREDYVAMGFRKIEIPISTYSDATKPFYYRSLHPVTNLPTGNLVEVRIGHCYHTDPDHTGEYGQFSFDNASTQAQIDSRSYPYAYSERLNGVDDVYIRVHAEATSIPDAGNILAVEVTKTQYMESEYFAVSGADKNTNRTPDIYGNDYGDLYTLRRTYAAFRKDNPYVVPQGWPDSKTNNGYAFPTSGYTLVWTLSLLRETFYTLFQDDTRLSHEFPIGSSKYYQDARTVNCGCRGIAYGPPRQKTTPASPIQDFAVINLGMPPRPRGNFVSDIYAPAQPGGSSGVFFINEDNQYANITQNPWCWENWNGAQGTNTDLDNDGRSGGWPTNVYINKNDQFWGRNPANPGAGISGSPDPMNPVFIWRIKCIKPSETPWHETNRGPIFDPGQYLFTEGGVYQIQSEVSCYIYDYDRILYPPFYWDEASALVAANGGSGTPFSMENRIRTITVKAVAKPPNLTPGNLRIALVDKSSGAEVSTPTVTVDEDILTKFGDLAGSMGYRPCLYMIPNQDVNLSRSVNQASGFWKSSKVRFAPNMIPDSWRLGDPSNPADTAHRIDKFSGLVATGANSPKLKIEITPAKTVGSSRYFKVSQAMGATAEINGTNDTSTSPDRWFWQWDMVAAANSIEIGAGLQSLPPGTNTTNCYYDAYLTPFADAALQNSSFPELDLIFNTPILPGLYTVTFSLSYTIRSWTPVYENPGDTNSTIIGYNPVETTPTPATFSWKVRVLDKTAPIVEILGGPIGNGSFPDEHQVETFTASGPWTYTANTFSGATTGDEFPLQRLQEISVVVTDNNPNFGPAGFEDHKALLFYKNPQGPQATDTDWEIFPLAASSRSVLDEAGNPVTASAALEHGEFRSRTSFVYNGSATFRMPFAVSDVTYHAVGADGPGNGPLWTDAYGSGTTAGVWGDYTPPSLTFLPKNIATANFALRSGIVSDVNGVPWDSAVIGVLDNDPPDISVTVQTQTAGTTTLHITGVDEPALNGTLGAGEALWDTTVWNGNAPGATSPLTGFRVSVTNDKSGTVAETALNITEQDLYRYLPGGDSDGWVVDFTPLPSPYPVYAAAFPLKIMEDERFVISIEGKDNMEGEMKLENLRFAQVVDQATGVVTAPANAGIDMVTTESDGTVISTLPLMAPYKSILRDPTPESRNQFLRCWIMDTTGNKRIVQIPLRVFDTMVRVQTLEVNQ